MDEGDTKFLIAISFSCQIFEAGKIKDVVGVRRKDGRCHLLFCTSMWANVLFLLERGNKTLL